LATAAAHDSLATGFHLEAYRQRRRRRMTAAVPGTANPHGNVLTAAQQRARGSHSLKFVTISTHQTFRSTVLGSSRPTFSSREVLETLTT